jgi:hypothetical protein
MEQPKSRSPARDWPTRSTKPVVEGSLDALRSWQRSRHCWSARNRSVLWLSGLGGGGKTALMRACADRARQASWRTARIDGRTVAQSPQAFADTVSSAAARDRSATVDDGADASGLAIFIDT